MYERLEVCLQAFEAVTPEALSNEVEIQKRTLRQTRSCWKIMDASWSKNLVQNSSVPLNCLFPVILRELFLFYSFHNSLFHSRSFVGKFKIETFDLGTIK